MFKRLKNLLTERGFLLTVVLASACMTLFFGQLMIRPNQVYFGASDDGLQAYYGAIYHVKYDTTYWHMGGMNYPYGDQVFFTGCQPFISNTIKLVSEVIDISDFTVGILNMIMLFSVFFSSICLYLIFKHLKLPYLYSSIAAISIAFLSPQIVRLVCHYSLTYQFAIPLFFLLLLKFEQAPSLKKSLIISAIVFFMAGTHFYYFGFFALLSLFYWVVLFFRDISLKNFKFVLVHSFIQIVLPFLLFQLIIFLIDDVHDRTSNPWGYLAYISNIAGVFYPSGGKPYQDIFNRYIESKYPDTLEGFSYVGIVATLTCVLLVLRLLKRLAFFEFTNLLSVTDNKILNTFFWASIFALLLAFGYPFIISGYHHWFQYVGPLKQMRGVARFAWAFYYIINIISLYKIFQWMSNKKPVLKNTVLTLVLMAVCCDAYYMTKPMEKILNNKLPRITDKNNTLPENNWLNEININDYQGIMTLPYVHVGSENVWRCFDSFEIMSEAYITSLKTGLPTMSSVMSRTSLSQTFKNIQIVLEPYRPMDIVSDFKNKKPFLVLVIENQVNADEKPLLEQSKKLRETPAFNIYELPFSVFERRSDSLYLTALSSLNKKKTYPIDTFLYTDSLKTFSYNGFQKKTNLNTINNNFYLGRISEYNLLFFDSVPNYTIPQEYTVSFWMDNFTEDLYPRTTCVVECFDSVGTSFSKEEFAVGQRLHLRVLDGHKALIETKVKLNSRKDFIAVSVSQIDIFDKEKMFKASELFIHPSKDKVYKIPDSKSIICNNRLYLKR